MFAMQLLIFDKPLFATIDESKFTELKSPFQKLRGERVKDGPQKVGFNNILLYNAYYTTITNIQLV